MERRGVFGRLAAVAAASLGLARTAEPDEPLFVPHGDGYLKVGANQKYAFVYAGSTRPRWLQQDDEQEYEFVTCEIWWPNRSGSRHPALGGPYVYERAKKLARRDGESWRHCVGCASPLGSEFNDPRCTCHGLINDWLKQVILPMHDRARRKAAEICRSRGFEPVLISDLTMHPARG